MIIAQSDCAGKFDTFGAHAAALVSLEMRRIDEDES